MLLSGNPLYNGENDRIVNKEIFMGRLPELILILADVHPAFWRAEIA